MGSPAPDPDADRVIQQPQVARLEAGNSRRRYSMAVPKSKISRAKRGSRRSTDALKADAYVEDKDSGELRRPHHIDLKTGMYRGRQILEPKEEF